MKKFLAKLAVFTLISLNLSLALMPAAFAYTTQENLICSQSQVFGVSCDKWQEETCIRDFGKLTIQESQDGLDCFPLLSEKQKSDVRKTVKEKSEGFCQAIFRKSCSSVTAEELEKSNKTIETEDNLSSAFFSAMKDAKTQPCIQELKYDENGLLTAEPGPDNGYIITIIEEPIRQEQSSITTADGAEFESRICYRNVISFTDSTNKEHTSSILSLVCSRDGEDYANPQNPGAIRENRKFACQQVQVLLSKGGTSLIEGFISTVYQWAAGIVGLIAVTVIILNAIQISASGGDTQAIENAKNRIIKSIAGIVVLFLSGLILYTINPTFFIR